ncbi:MAG TPA: dienelactone hydrolase family protein [Allocoleopsis sp.]
MSSREIRTDSVKIANNSLEIQAYLAMPVAEEPLPGVVVLQEIFGVNEHIRDVTRRLAQEGYIAIAPALYQRQAPDFETGYTAEDIAIGRQYKDKTTADELLSDIQSAIDYLINHTPTKADAIGCIGFCFGGHVAYLAATLPAIKATASFYGAGITTMTPGGGDPTVTRTPEIKGTLYAFFGMQDASIPAEQVEEVEQALEQHHVPHRIFRYPDAEHGFFCDRRASYNPAAAADAWNQVKQLFTQELQ